MNLCRCNLFFKLQRHDSKIERTFYQNEHRMKNRMENFLCSMPFIHWIFLFLFHRIFDGSNFIDIAAYLDSMEIHVPLWSINHIPVLSWRWLLFNSWYIGDTDVWFFWRMILWYNLLWYNKPKGNLGQIAFMFENQ